MLQKIILVSVVVSVVVVVVLDSCISRGSVLAMAADSDAESLQELDQDQPVMMLDGSAQSLAMATSNGIQCESITVPHCKQMIYNTTTMPNFFDDLNQVEAHTRAQHYRPLIESHCNPSISTYLCQLITPVCLEQDVETMYKFKIYPCRTFCRRMMLDCGQEISGLNMRLKNQLMPAFDCDQLPYEANGGNSTPSNLYGPCHDPYMEEQQQQQQQQQQLLQQQQQQQTQSHPDHNNDQYKPFKAQLEDPYITDKSSLDIYPPFKSPTKIVNHEPATKTSPPPNNIIATNGRQQNNNHSWTHQINVFAQSMIAALVKYSNIITIITMIVLLAALNAKRLRKLQRFYSSSSASSSSSSSACSSSAPLNAGSTITSAGLNGNNKTRNFAHDQANSGSGGYHTALARQQQIYSNILLSSPSHQVLLLNDGSPSSQARSKLMPLTVNTTTGSGAATSGNKQHSRVAPPQTRAPLPPPLLGTGCYLSSDQQSSSGYYDEPVPISPFASANNYDAPIHQPLNDSLRRGSFNRRRVQHTNYQHQHHHRHHPSSSSGSSSSSTPNKQAGGAKTTIQSKQQNNMLFMG